MGLLFNISFLLQLSTAKAESQHTLPAQPTELSLPSLQRKATGTLAQVPMPASQEPVGGTGAVPAPYCH